MIESVEGGRSGGGSGRGKGEVREEDGASSKVEMEANEDGARGMPRKKDEMDSSEQARDTPHILGKTGEEGWERVEVGWADVGLVVGLGLLGVGEAKTGVPGREGEGE